MAKFRITFSNGANSNDHKTYDIEADNSDEAFRFAYGTPEANQRWRYSDVSVMEIKNGPKTIGVCFTYTQSGRSYVQYLFIRAEDEEQARQFYQTHLKGRRFWQPWPDKPNDEGNCVYGKIKETYFAGGDGYAFDATA